MNQAPRLSVIFPTDSEPETDFLAEALTNLRQVKDCEVILVGLDQAPTRAERLNIGVHLAKGSMILFNHPRSRLDREGIEYLIRNSEKIMWGGFTHRFDLVHPLLAFTSWYSNRVRPRVQGILYLDHCIFFHRSLWRADIPAVAIFEDTLLSKELRLHSRPKLLSFKSTTSAIRFQRNGIFKQAILNQLMKLAFYLNLPHDKINRLYESGLGLNSSRQLKAVKDE